MIIKKLQIIENVKFNIVKFIFTVVIKDPVANFNTLLLTVREKNSGKIGINFNGSNLHNFSLEYRHNWDGQKILDRLFKLLQSGRELSGDLKITFSCYG